MKHLLLTTIAAVLVVGCGPSAPDISIHEATGRGDIEAVKQHLAAGTDVNAKDDKFGFTPLHYATFSALHLMRLNDHKEIVELLIANGADVNARRDGGAGGTPLHFAAGGLNEIAELLIAKGADVNAKDDGGYTPLDWAVGHKHPETADLLRKHGGKHGTIHGAARGGDIEAVKEFLAAGADVNAKNVLDETPLDLAKGETANLLRKHGGKTTINQY